MRTNNLRKDKLGEYWRLDRIRDLAKELNYEAILRLLEDDDEISELYNDMKDSWGMEDSEIRKECYKLDHQQQDNKLYYHIWRALDLYTDLDFEEVLQVYEGNCTPALFMLVNGFEYIIGTMEDYNSGYPTWRILDSTEDEQEAQDSFVKHLNFISGF
jgi:hypothetical protein